MKLENPVNVVCLEARPKALWEAGVAPNTGKWGITNSNPIGSLSV